MDFDLDSELQNSDEVTIIADDADVRDERIASMLKSTLGFGLTVMISIGFSATAPLSPSCGILLLSVFLVNEGFSVVMFSWLASCSLLITKESIVVTF